MTLQPLSLLEAFPAAALAFSRILAWAQQQAPQRASLSGFENGATERLREVGRLLVQGFFDGCFEAELAATQGQGHASGRLVECTFGEVYERRLAEPQEGKSRFPLDAQLNLPPERYSLGVRQLVAHVATSQPLGTIVQALAKAGVHVPKRQVQQLVERASQDVEAFYALPQHHGASNDADACEMLVGSHDATGVLVRKEALRPDTKKKVESSGKKPKGDPTATAVPQRHSHRMAAVGAVWDQPVVVRGVDVLTDDKKAANELPRPQNKQVSALLKRGTQSSVRRVLERMQQRDPGGQRPKAMLVDGENKQLAAVKSEAKKLGLTVQIVLDPLHALHYVYLAGKALYCSMSTTRGH
jgi:hypothetical protein